MIAADQGDRFVHDLEVLEVCRELLLSGSDAKGRMALILLDGLADALLYRRIENAYAASEERWYFDNPRFPKSVRTRARLNFGERLRVANMPFRDFLVSGTDEPLVSEFDTAVLLIGHSYRNAAYHRDTHNPAVIVPLGKLMFATVVAVFARFHCDDAASVVDRLMQGLDVSVDEVGEQLGDDLEARIEGIEEWRACLPLDDSGMEAMLTEQDFWHKHGVDDELIRLGDLCNPIVQAVRLGIDPTPELAEEARGHEPDYRARLSELRKAFGGPSVSLNDLQRARVVAQQIRQTEDLTTVLSLYHEADHSLAVLEEYVGEAVAAHDRHVQLETDIARGK